VHLCGEDTGDGKITGLFEKEFADLQQSRFIVNVEERIHPVGPPPAIARIKAE